MGRAVKSALSQSNAEIQVIVVGDSVDPASLLPNFDDPRLHCIAAQKQGRSAAGNTGLAAATTAFAGFLDDDDELLPNHVQLLEAALSNAPEAVAAYARSEELSVANKDGDQRIRKRRVRHYRPFSLAELWLSNQMPIQAVLFRTEIFHRLGGMDATLHALEDWDLWLRYAQAGPFIAIAEVTSRFALPHGKLAMLARSNAHSPALEYLRVKHARLAAPMTFSTIQTLNDYLSERLDDYVSIRYSLRRLWRWLYSGW